MKKIQKLIEAGALFVCNHSGGKDSQAMANILRKMIPANQLVIIHAHLPEVEWEGTVEHINNTIGETEFHIVQANKTFFDMVNHRQMFPSPKNRQCTSDLKRGPIQKKVKEICNKRGFKIVVNCMGLRAEESSGRAKKSKFKKNATNTNTKRDWYDWLPIHNWSTVKVFSEIKAAGQQPFWTYAEGMQRKSCCFCIMACHSDLKIAARLRPELAEKYMQKEEELKHTLSMPVNGQQKFLREIINQ